MLAFRTVGAASISLQKRRHRAIQRVGDGTKQFRLFFLNHAVGTNGLNTGIQQVLFDLRHGLRQTIERRVNLVQAALIKRQQFHIDLIRRTQIRHAGVKSLSDLAGITTTDIRERGQERPGNPAQAV